MKFWGSIMLAVVCFFGYSIYEYDYPSYEERPNTPAVVISKFQALEGSKNNIETVFRLNLQTQYGIETPAVTPHEWATAEIGDKWTVTATEFIEGDIPDWVAVIHFITGIYTFIFCIWFCCWISDRRDERW